MLWTTLLATIATFSTVSFGTSLPGLESIECVRPKTCRNTTTGKLGLCRNFNRRIECCNDESGKVTLQKVTTGAQCCRGHRIIDIQTYECPEDGSPPRRRKSTRYCEGSSNLEYNTITQYCCTSSNGVSQVYMKNDNYACCGSQYINEGEGCCNEERYDNTTKCCKNGKIVDKNQCVQTTECLEPIVCPKFEMDDRFEKMKRKLSLVYVFEVSAVTASKNDMTYKVNFFGQLNGNKNKIRPVVRKLKKIVIPKCGCPGSLILGQKYLLISRSKVRRSKLTLRGNKYFLRELDEFDTLSQLFDL